MWMNLKFVSGPQNCKTEPLQTAKLLRCYVPFTYQVLCIKCARPVQLSKHQEHKWHQMITIFICYFIFSFFSTTYHQQPTWPANANATWSSRSAILRTVRSSWSLATAFFSTPRTTISLPRTPTYTAPKHRHRHVKPIWLSPLTEMD